MASFIARAVGVYATEPPVSSEGAPPELNFALERILCILRGYQRALMNADERVKWAKRRRDGRLHKQKCEIVCSLSPFRSGGFGDHT